jgi:hypothetical protein
MTIVIINIKHAEDGSLLCIHAREFLTWFTLSHLLLGLILQLLTLIILIKSILQFLLIRDVIYLIENIFIIEYLNEGDSEDESSKHDDLCDTTSISKDGLDSLIQSIIDITNVAHSDDGSEEDTTLSDVSNINVLNFGIELNLIDDSKILKHDTSIRDEVNILEVECLLLEELTRSGSESRLNELLNRIPIVLKIENRILE